MEYQAFYTDPFGHGSFWVFIAIVIFLGLVGRKIIAAITGMLDKRTQSVRDALDEAAQLKAEAERILGDAKAKQAQAVEDAKQILASAQTEAARMAAELTEEAQATAKRRERLALERIAEAEASAVKEVRAAAIDIATAASAAVLRENFGAEADAAIIDQAIAGVPGALRQAI
jgi:F-type H+-transporting ATPase subunit b